MRYPDAEEDSPPLRAAPLTPGEAAALTDSPVRRELVRRIASGESVVWLLLESGDRAGDDRAAEVLTAELRALERELRLPAGIGEAGSRLHSDLPLRIAFSVLRMSRTDPAERWLTAQLLGSGPGLADRDEPMVFPVFGRGRTLEPLVGRGIDREVIAETAAFLCGRCGCEVKRLNPGVDLLITADWEGLLASGPPPAPRPPPLVGLSPPAAAAVPPDSPAGSAAVPPDLPAPEPADPPAGGLARNLVLAAAGGAVLLATHDPDAAARAARTATFARPGVLAASDDP